MTTPCHSPQFDFQDLQFDDESGLAAGMALDSDSDLPHIQSWATSSEVYSGRFSNTHGTFGVYVSQRKAHSALPPCPSNAESPSRLTVLEQNSAKDAFVYLVRRACLKARAIPPKFSQIFSPCIVASTFLLCFPFLNSRNHMPCHVPVASFPLEIGMLTLAPMSDDLICACRHSQSAIAHKW